MAIACLSCTVVLAEPTYTLRVSPRQLVTSETDFAPFARDVAADVETALRSTPASDTARWKLLLGLRVHLALHFGDDAAALDAAERIQALQTDPGDRAHAGVTTRALVAAKHDPAKFEREFTRLLAALPRSPEVRSALERGRARIAAITEQALLDEVQLKIAPRLAAGEPCTLELADQLVRVRHRLAGILPLREAMLRAYDVALAARH